MSLEDHKFRSLILLSLLSIKPHLLLGIYLLLITTKKWVVLWGGIAATISVLTITNFILGSEIWWAFLNATQEAGLFLSEGYYKFFRMISFYASLRTLGFSAEISLITQFIVGLGALSVIIFAVRQRWRKRHLLAISLMASLFVSPYAYDYDLQILGVAVAYLLPDLCRRASGKQILLVLAGGWLSTASTLVRSFYEIHNSAASAEISEVDLISINFWGLFFVCAYSIRIVRKGNRT